MAGETIDRAVQMPGSRELDRDLGFGSIVAGQSKKRFINRDGSFNVERTGLNFLSSLNLYHTLLTISWPAFLGMMLLLFFLSNVVFGSLYATIGASALVDTSESPMSSPWLRGFFFSVQTFATIGYGTIHPVGVVTNLLVTLESYYSLLANALITGLVFARFARPTSRIVLSDTAAISPYRDITAFMFRTVNGRSNQLLEVRAQVMLARWVNENGQTVRRFDPLELERRSVTFFPLSWTVVHPIDKNSPLYGVTESELKATDAEFLILLTAVDETFSTAVHQRSSYKMDEVKWGYKFVNIYNKTQNGEPISINVRRLSEMEPAPEIQPVFPVSQAG